MSHAEARATPGAAALHPAPGTGAESLPLSAGTAPEALAPAILYSFRRCPYAIRARLALAAAGLRPGVDLELRELSLQAKPPELLAASAKGTVPVLVLPQAAGEATDRACGAVRGGPVIDESLAIQRWALARRDPGRWLTDWDAAARSRMEELIAENDGPFKHHLDRFKYASRYGKAGEAGQAEHRERALAILRRWEQQLRASGWLLGDRPSLADMALLPFVRQYRLADPAGFDAEADLGALQNWLQRFLSSPLLQTVMQAPWAPRHPWRSPGWLYHLALSEEWRAARASGVYARSTRGMSLEQVGFIHASYAHQVAATQARFYADLPSTAVRLLTLDPGRLAAAGVAVLAEPAPDSGELFPHLYGALPCEAVLHDEPYPP